MDVIPVIDLKCGVVVRGIAGRRSEYRPVVSRLTASASPRDVAAAFREKFGFTELYVADLDAIGGETPDYRTCNQLHELGFTLLVDAGVREIDRVRSLASAGIAGIVLGSETVPGLDPVRQACNLVGADRLVFSLDLRDGKPLGCWSDEPERLAGRVIDLGIPRLIVLDLARVGMSGGTGTEDLCRRLAKSHPQTKIIAGGGVRDADDLARLQEIGVRGVLVASALHDGRLTGIVANGGRQPPERGSRP
jgi:phosphoribosylformimino-5-aminoimidazole carboxamide ribotide isomerase